jgi:hypothetical protein
MALLLHCCYIVVVVTSPPPASPPPTGSVCVSHIQLFQNSCVVVTVLPCRHVDDDELITKESSKHGG